jgi:hypothetical protein
MRIYLSRGFPSHPLVLIYEWNAVFGVLALAAGFVFVVAVRDRGRSAHDAAPGSFKNRGGFNRSTQHSPKV